MIKFRQKVFGGAVMSNADKFYKYVLPTASFGVATGSLALSAARNRQMKEQNAQQLAAMDRLSRSLGRVDKSLARSSESFDKYSASLHHPVQASTSSPANARKPAPVEEKKRGIFNLF